MKVGCCLSAILMFCIICGISAASNSSQDVYVNVLPKEVSVKSGVDVDIVIALYNKTGRALTLEKSMENREGEADYVIDVERPAGARVERTAYGNNIYKGGQLSVSGVYKKIGVAPGGALYENATPSEIYDMREPGNYIIRASRRLPMSFGGQIVVSPPVIVRVEP